MKVLKFEEFIKEDFSAPATPAYGTLDATNGMGAISLPSGNKPGSGDLALQIGEKPQTQVVNKIMIKNKKYFDKKYKNKLKKKFKVSLVDEEGEEFFNGEIKDVDDKKAIVVDDGGNIYTIYLM